MSIGKKYNGLVSIGMSNNGNYTRVKCVKCGNTGRVLRTKWLDKFKPEDCGCETGDINYKAHMLYPRWKDIYDKTTVPTHRDYPTYGGKGIKMCKEWEDYTNFINWGEKYFKIGYQLVRRDQNGGYNPDNCIFDITSLPIKTTNTYSGIIPIMADGNTLYSYKLKHKGKVFQQGGFKTDKLAAEARDKMVLENRLPKRLITTRYGLGNCDGIIDWLLSNVVLHQALFYNETAWGILSNSAAGKFIGTFSSVLTTVHMLDEYRYQIIGLSDKATCDVLNEAKPDIVKYFTK